MIQTIASSGDVRRRVERRAARSTSRRRPNRSRRTAASTTSRSFERLDVPADIFRRCRWRRGRARLDAAADAHRRVLVSLRVSLRVRGAALDAHARDRGDVRHPRRVRDARPTDARKRSRHAARHDLRKLAKRSAARRRLGLLPRHEVGSVRDDAGALGAGRARKIAATAVKRRSAYVTKRVTLARRARAGSRATPASPIAPQRRVSRSRSPPPRWRRWPRRAPTSRPRAARLHASPRPRSARIRSTRRRACSRSSRSTKPHQAMRASSSASILSAIHETAAGATSTASYNEAERLLLVSNTKTTALVLDALIREAPAARAHHQARARRARRRRHAAAGCRRRRTSSCCGDAPLLRRVREGHAELHGQAVVRRQAAYTEQSFVGRVECACLGDPRLVDARARHERTTSRWSEDRAGSDVLPHRHHVRAASRSNSRRSTPASSCVGATRPSTIQRRRAARRRALEDQARREACVVQLEAVNTTQRYRSRSSIRCRRASRR